MIRIGQDRSTQAVESAIRIIPAEPATAARQVVWAGLLAPMSGEAGVRP
jgi:hypothetical protein